MIMVNVVVSKGVDACALESVRRALEQFGRKRIILRSDSEPEMPALKEAVRMESELKITLEDVPVSDHQANGTVRRRTRRASSEC